MEFSNLLITLYKAEILEHNHHHFTAIIQVKLR